MTEKTMSCELCEKTMIRKNAKQKYCSACNGIAARAQAKKMRDVKKLIESNAKTYGE